MVERPGGACAPAPAARQHVPGRVDVERGLVRLFGEIDLSCAEVFALRLQEVAAATEGDVTVDMSAVDFVDSTALTVLTSADVRLRPAGRRVVVAEPSLPVRRVLTLSGLDGRFAAEAG